MKKFKITIGWLNPHENFGAIEDFIVEAGDFNGAWYSGVTQILNYSTGAHRFHKQIISVEYLPKYFTHP